MAELTGADRCDAKDCGSRAYVRVHITLGSSPLLFCGHCYHVREAALVLKAILIVDERDTIGVLDASPV